MKKLNLGFTLVEILIALTIFSIMAGITSSVLYSVFNARDKTTVHTQKLSEMQLALVIIEQDLSQILFKPVKTFEGKQTSVFGLANEVRFSRGGIANPTMEKKQSSIVRVHYFVENEKLIRQSEAAVNRDLIIDPNQQILLNDVTKLQIEYINEAQMAQTSWAQKKLPYAIRLTIHTPYWGKLSQIFMLNQSRLYYAKK